MIHNSTLSLEFFFSNVKYILMEYYCILTPTLQLTSTKSWLSDGANIHFRRWFYVSVASSSKESVNSEHHSRHIFFKFDFKLTRAYKFHKSKIGWKCDNILTSIAKHHHGVITNKLMFFKTFSWIHFDLDLFQKQFPSAISKLMLGKKIIIIFLTECFDRIRYLMGLLQVDLS